jgi:hypothetical protein
LRHDGLDQALVERIPDLDIPAIPRHKTRKFKERKKRFLIDLLHRSFRGSSRHKDSDSLDSFSSRTLLRELGLDYQDFLKSFYSFVPGNLGYSKTAKATKTYQLKPRVEDAIQDAYRVCSTGGVVVSSNRVLTSKSLPANGVGSDRSSLTVPSVIPVDLPTLNETIRMVDARLAFTPDLRVPSNQLLWCRLWVLTLGGVPNLYVDRPDSRLGPTGELHLIPISRQTRYLLLRGKGLYDFDFSGCHLSIFRSLASHFGVVTPRLEDYLTSKAQVHQIVGEDFGVGSSAFKEFLLSLLYGGSLTPHPNTSNTQLLGYEKHELLSRSEWIREFYEEIKTGCGTILENHPPHLLDGKRVTQNVRGALTGATKKGSRLYHILVGYESYCVEVACRDFHDNVVLIYDGWISPDRDCHAIEESIRRQSQQDFGFPLEMIVKKVGIDQEVANLLSTKIP